MRFATVRQVVVLSIVWCVALFTLDYFKNPQLWKAEAAPQVAAEGVHVDLWMSHLCCTGCLGDIRAALAGVPGLGTPTVVGKELISQIDADVSASEVNQYANMARVPVTDLAKVDFVAIDAALRAKGLIASRMEFGGLDHFRIEAELNHLCCGVCEKATYEGLNYLKARGLGGQLKWLDSVNVDKLKKKVIAHARYLESGKTIDVGEFISALGYVGFAPLSVRILPGDPVGGGVA
jgi:copper chaperone CopZ